MTTSTTTNATPSLDALLPPLALQQLISDWLSNDMPSWDVGGMVVGTAVHTAVVYQKSSGLLAGQVFVNAVFHQLQCQIDWKCPEGSVHNLLEGEKLAVATVTGPVCFILQGERLALNILSRCSGVATTARTAVELANNTHHHWHGWVAGTRKTTPGFAVVEKYALLVVAGVATHRLDLSQMVMLKDNHIQAHGSITQAVQMAKRAAGFSQKIEVECSSLSEALEAAKAGADIIMLDNYEPQDLKQDARSLKEQYPHVLIEASGGITMETMPNYMSEHVDIISQGALTQGYACIDFSLKITTPSSK